MEEQKVEVNLQSYDKKTQMRAVILEKFGSPLTIKIVDIPKPQPGEVLVKMEASPVNPSDLAFLTGNYSSKKQCPTIPGFEGSGTVVQSGGGIMGWSLNGKRVAVAASQSSYYGCWAEYMVVSAQTTIAIPDDVSFETAASSFVNPLTVITMLEQAQTLKAKCVVHNPGASALGRMMARYFSQNGVRVINIVRREEQVEILKKEGADFILNQTDENFDQNLKNLCKEQNATIYFDAVAGEMTSKVMKLMPNNTTAFVYGCLSLKPCEIDATGLIFRNQSVKGYWLSQELKNKNPIQMLLLINKLKGLLNTSLKTNISKEFDMQDAEEGIKYYKTHMSDGKVLIRSLIK